MEKKVIILLFIILILTETIFALRVSPAIIRDNFKPGLERVIEYSVLGEDPKKELELYVNGDLAEYVKLNKEKLVGGGVFTATLKLPEKIEKPGRHVIVVGVREKVDEELINANIGTSVTIQIIIVIDVPYPGKYLEISLKSNDANVGEPVNFELEIINKGKEKVNITPEIEIISNEQIIKTLYFKNREINSQENIKLRKVFDTTDYNPGNYTGVALVDYGIIARAESKFRIGELVVNIINYTKQIIIGGIKKFDIEIGSEWNNNIEGVYAEVFILDNSETLLSFKTSSTSLTPWEKKTIQGFFDTDNFTIGFYDFNMTLIYYGRNIGKSSSKLVEIEFVRTINKILIGLIVGIFILLVIGFFVKKYMLKSKKRGK